MDFKSYDYIIVGSGFYGTVIAERIANELDKKVLIIEKRNHIGGNCYSEIDSETNIEYHVYGTHIFHTSNEIVWKYISSFTDFNQYNHQVLTTLKDKVYQMPINLETINSFYNINLRPYEVDDFLNNIIRKEKIDSPNNFEEKAISLIGRDLYEAFIKGYTTKQWQTELKELPKELLHRLPFRKNYNESYYYSKWQGIPLNGYTNLFRNMLNHKNIDISLNTDFFEIRNLIPKNKFIIYSGPIDRFYNYKYGKLEWRTLEFSKEIKDFEDYQGTSVMNYAEQTIPYTRIHEPKHLHPERDNYAMRKTMIIKEFPKGNTIGDEYYPVNTTKNNQILNQYKKLAESEVNCHIGGRLGDYKYYDMHHTIDAALTTYNKLKQSKCTI